MYNRQFFSTQLGKVSALCIAAMVAFNLITVVGQFPCAATPTLVHAASVVVA
ncbi:hypothetical protein QQS45_01810 [Alteriqipengyuania flavescens]|uniref:hypothetical protein n=1 Tax=Alteriqipengyuania flavescens TaxID=3053610 RepID=UPI0025B568DE|nr:hypothetical protein [Alteriqipengyuania flavescens]WJY19002.1 hypothetical protein QQW98_01805 [Alteriqipengyuania flavescens]WJY24943.1 hypothetical protein QQS45_01810 [Alteriqipengyuania flavescens]